MPENNYDPEKFLSLAREWRLKAQAATTPEMRTFCLEEACRCEKVVQQSLETPAVIEVGPARGRSFRWFARRADASSAKTTLAVGSAGGHGGDRLSRCASNEGTKVRPNAVALVGDDAAIAPEMAIATGDSDPAI
jgi:hypothetical protein